MDLKYISSNRSASYEVLSTEQKDYLCLCLSIISSDWVFFHLQYEGTGRTMLCNINIHDKNLVLVTTSYQRIDFPTFYRSIFDKDICGILT